ncbi:auxin response factor [Vigna unguiculata]|uniref:Auxin response factor n=1 Tax=Vigna unguiculata TaxID=3917 RepID=A0A4D6KUR2_VIGUN|nr:auxin response factor [Vigna unguiculata]
MILFQVQWDEPSSILRPDRVSSWELEPHVSTTPANPQPTQRNKRARPLIVPSTVPDSSLQGMWKSPIESTTFSFDPQHRRGLYPSPKFNPSATNFIGFSGNSFVGPPSNKSIYWSNRMENSLESISPIALKEAGEKRQDTGNGCRLFGIQLLENSKAEGSLQTVNLSGRLGDDRFVPSLDAESDQQSEPSNANRCDIPSHLEPPPFVSCEQLSRPPSMYYE